MSTANDLTHLCLLVAAGGLVYETGEIRLRKAMPSSMRCALYMLIAFVARRNMSRRLTRKSSSLNNIAKSVSSNKAMFRQEVTAGRDLSYLLFKRALNRRGQLSICYQ